MRKAIFIKFIQVILAALVLNSVIFYIVTSSVMLQNARKDLLYTLETMDQILDYDGDLEEEVARLSKVTGENKSRFTLIRRDGSVAGDTGVVDTASMDSHLERKEVADALRFGSGSSRRYSDTLDATMLYGAIRSSNQDYVLRLAIPFTGAREYLIMLLPAVWLSFLAAMMFSAFSADKFSLSVTKPLEEISQEMSKGRGDYTELSFETYPYPEINIIAETTTKMSQNVKEYLNQVELERQIRQEFFSNASHELKTPITSICGYAELIENQIITDEELKADFIRRIKKESVNMTHIINDILLISRLEAKDAEVTTNEIYIPAVLDETLESLKPLCASRQVIIEKNCGPVRIRANAQQMTELFGNLIGNAVKYNRPGGQVWVTVREENRRLIICVKDNGAGIPEESINRIFERFYRVDKGRSRKDGGTGLGLSIVKHIVNFYQGTITVKSELGKGSEFIVTIPIQDGVC